MIENKIYKLFLDDYRVPLDCISYMHRRIGKDNSIYLEDWVIVKNYDEFCHTIVKLELPETISFDHDLSDEHYNDMDFDTIKYDMYVEKTGYHCAKWLIDYCSKNKLKLPRCIIHSTNPVGSENINSILKQAISE